MGALWKASLIRGTACKDVNKHQFIPLFIRFLADKHLNNSFVIHEFLAAVPALGGDCVSRQQGQEKGRLDARGRAIGPIFKLKKADEYECRTCVVAKR